MTRAKDCRTYTRSPAASFIRLGPVPWCDSALCGCLPMTAPVHSIISLCVVCILTHRFTFLLYFDAFHYFAFLAFLLPAHSWLPLCCLSSTLLCVFFPSSDLSLTCNSGLTVPPNTHSHTDWHMQCCIRDWLAPLWKASHVPVLLFLASFTVASWAQG